MPDHGTTARYRQGCRCSDCRRANTAYKRAYAKRRLAKLQATAKGHGRYGYYCGCRCQTCTTAASASVMVYARERRLPDDLSIIPGGEPRTWVIKTATGLYPRIFFRKRDAIDEAVKLAETLKGREN